MNAVRLPGFLARVPRSHLVAGVFLLAALLYPVVNPWSPYTQGVALLMFLPFDGLASLYVVSAMFGLFQGGIVPSYAIIVREYFPPREAGVRTGIVLMATLFGMAFGGWISGVIFDFTGSYRAAFLNGIAFNLLNLTIATWLLRRTRTPARTFG